MIECTKFTNVQKGTFQGYANIYVEKWGIEINGCSLFMKDGRRWVNMPSKEYTNKEGEKKFQPVIFFKDKSNHDLFCNKIKEAIDKWCKENAQTQQVQETPPKTEFNNSDCPF